MGWLRFLRRARRDEDAAAEIAAHLQIEEDERRAQGLSPADARAAALKKFGNPVRVREDLYLMNTIGPLDTLWQDLRFALRLLARERAFAAAALVSLALGIGANTAIFQLLDAVRLRTLPVAAPETLVEVRPRPGQPRSGRFNGRHPMFSYAQIEELGRRQEAFSGLAVWSNQRFNTAPAGERVEIDGLLVNGDFFSTLGVAPVAGRTIGPGDDRPGCPAVAVLSDAYWQQAHGGSPAVVGRTVRFEGVPVEVIGVTPPAFFGVEMGRQYDAALPLCAEAVLNPGSNRLDLKWAWWLGAFGRLKPGWTLERAHAHVEALSAGLYEATLPDVYQAEDRAQYLALELQAIPAGAGVSALRRQFGEPLALLLAITGLVLVIACANLINLLLARATARSREIAVRLAMGASRARVVRQLLTESLLLAAVGASLGAWLAQLLVGLLVSVLASGYTALFLDLRFDWRVFGFTAAVALGACLLFGVVPALGATALSPASTLRAGGRGLTASRARLGLRRLLVAAQVALSLVLVIGGVLFARTLYNVWQEPAGFRHEGVVGVRLTPREGPATPEGARAAARRAREALAAIPGVAHVAEASMVPLTGNFWNENLWVDGPDGPGDRRLANFNRVGEGYLRALEIPLRQGRDFAPADTPTSPPVALVSESFVRRFIADGRALGRTIRVEAPPGEPEPVYEIVGVVGDTKYGDIRETIEPLVLLASSQDAAPGPRMQFVVASAIGLDAVRPAIARAAAGLGPEISLEIEVLADAVRNGLVRERLMAALSLAFGLLAVVLAAVGLYGVMAYSVSFRATEIGVRLALGARAADVRRMVLGEAAAVVAVGLAAGTLIGMAAARAAESLLFGLTPGDPWTFVTAAVLLALVGLAAGYVPARRAARLDPASVLRAD